MSIAEFSAPMAHPIASRMADLDKLAMWLDSKWRLPGTQIYVGYDTLIGLIPGIGDTITTLISAYIIRQADLLGVPGWIKWRMAWNVAVDWFIGIIPLVGDIFDIGWKANIKNVELIKRHAKLSPTT